MLTKDEFAQKLAAFHYQVEPGMKRIHRVIGPGNTESKPDEPVKLLEANKHTVASGILPLGFDPFPSRGIPYSYVIMEVTPAEFRKIKTGELPLPHGWMVGKLIPRPADNGAG